MAHIKDLLDEALKETFPASDPIAINVEHESPEHEIATTPGFILRSDAHRRGRGTGDAATAGLNLEPTHEQSVLSRYDASRRWR